MIKYLTTQANRADQMVTNEIPWNFLMPVYANGTKKPLVVYKDNNNRWHLGKITKNAKFDKNEKPEY
jgi:hypothetical protein